MQYGFDVKRAKVTQDVRGGKGNKGDEGRELKSSISQQLE